jgi:hypothetical protein
MGERAQAAIAAFRMQKVSDQWMGAHEQRSMLWMEGADAVEVAMAVVGIMDVVKLTPDPNDDLTALRLGSDLEFEARLPAKPFH